MYVVLMKHNNHLKEKQQESNLPYFERTIFIRSTIFFPNLLCKVLQEQPYSRKKLKKVEILSRELVVFFLSHDTILTLCGVLYYSQQRYSFTQIINILIHSEIYTLILGGGETFLIEFDKLLQKRDFLYSNLYLPIQNHSLVWSHTIFATDLGEYTIKKNTMLFTLKFDLQASVLQRSYGNEHYDFI